MKQNFNLETTENSILTFPGSSTPGPLKYNLYPHWILVDENKYQCPCAKDRVPSVHCVPRTVYQACIVCQPCTNHRSVFKKISLYSFIQQIDSHSKVKATYSTNLLFPVCFILTAVNHRKSAFSDKLSRYVRINVLSQVRSSY